MNAQYDESTGLPALASEILSYLIPTFSGQVPAEWLRIEPLISWMISRRWTDSSKANRAYQWATKSFEPSGAPAWLGGGYITYMRQHPQDAAQWVQGLQGQGAVTQPGAKSPGIVIHANSTNAVSTKRPSDVINSTNQTGNEGSGDAGAGGTDGGGFDQSGDGDTQNNADTGSGGGIERTGSSKTGIIIGALVAGAALLGGVAYYLQKHTKRNPTWKYNQEDYTHYLCLNGKILSGWSYKEDAKDAKEDLPVEQKAAKIYSKRHLKSIGVDPDEDDNWGTTV